MQALARPPARFVFSGAVLLGLLNLACPGGLGEDTGSGGSGNAGASGGAGGSSGTGGSGPPPCDAFTTILSGQRCSTVGCHSASDIQGVELQSPGVIARLLNVKSTSALCGSNPTPYLIPGSNPAAGLFMDKFLDVPPCGSSMPYGGFGGDLNPQEVACISEWATAVTTGRLSQ